MLDILNELKFYSAEFQRRHGLLVTQSKTINNLEHVMDLMQTENGAYLNSFLGDVKCWNGSRAHETACSEQQLYNSDHVEYLEIPLKQDSDIQPLHEIRTYLLNNLKEEIQSYFPVEDLEMFSLLDPDEWSQGMDPETFGLSWLTELSDMFEFDKEIIVHEWKELVRNINEDSNFCQLKGTNARDFWGHYLSQDTFVIPPTIRQFVSTIVVIPIGSADAERAFSVMNHIKHKRRSRLTDVILEDLLRIRLNGASKLEEFPAKKYSKLWHERGNMLSDNPQGTRKSRPSFQKNGDPTDEGDKMYLDGSTLF